MILLKHLFGSRLRSLPLANFGILAQILLLACSLSTSSITDKAKSTEILSEQRVQVLQTTSSGDIKATLLSFEVEALPFTVTENRTTNLKKLRLKISRQGNSLFDGYLPVNEFQSIYPEITAFYMESSSIGSEPEVIINLGGASDILIYYYDPIRRRYNRLPKPSTHLQKTPGGKIATTRTNAVNELVAELSYQGWRSFQPRLKINQGNQTLLDQSVVLKDYIPAHQYDYRNLFEVYGPAIIDLDGDMKPEVILYANSSGIHCCAYWLIYSYNPSQRRYTSLEHNWGYRPAMPQVIDLDHDGIPELKGGDDRFTYEFGGYAGTVYPTKIWQYRQGKIIDVTQRFPGFVLKDSRDLLKLLNQSNAPPNNGAILAAYLANMYSLNQGKEGWEKVRRNYRGEGKEQYFNHLSQFLRKTGYAP